MENEAGPSLFDWVLGLTTFAANDLTAEPGSQKKQ